MTAYLYVLNTLSDWEIGYITAELFSGRYLKKESKGVPLIKIGSSMEPVTTMGGMKITPDDIFQNTVFREDDLLILPGANTWMETENQQVIDRIKDLSGKNVIVAAICGATIALAKKGLLDNSKHTSNDKGYLMHVCPEYKGSDLYVNDPAVTDKNMITASGLAPLEFAYHILKAIDVMNPDTLECWYALNRTKEPKEFVKLMQTLR